MYRSLVKLSRAVFHWPPKPALVPEKHATVRRWGKERGIANFIETGTYHGNMVEAQREHFRTLVTIELSPELHRAAAERFKPYAHIHVLQGDSGKMLAEAVRLIHGPAVFWLDAHYSKGITARGEKETPILQELSIIADRHEPNDVILIDDARHFNLHPGYPRLSRVRKFVDRHCPSHALQVVNDIICITPRAPGQAR
jgi:hypothetical protein